ncbi:anti-sigma factor family protein [Actinomadura flavalba]|uniref:anti-sigma factor family protein n=1 Tax=Actinomadura flavalba TaxID=1120938 RepID=UPI0003803507|nr:zf-HC2 domain-containing protein [Actinomadura flavalba]
MSCLGERLTALVDGELDHDERDAAYAHLTGCAACRAEAVMLRGLKGRLRGLGDGPAEQRDTPSGDFLARLRALAEQTPHDTPDPVRDAVPVSASAFRPRRAPSRPAGHARVRPGDGRPAARVGALRDPRRAVVAVGAATLFLGLGSATYLAGDRDDAPYVTPAFDRFAVEHALVSGDVPVSDPLTDPRTFQTAVPLPPGP